MNGYEFFILMFSIASTLGWIFTAIPNHRHQWLPWAKHTLANGEPLTFSGAFGYRETEVRVCASCYELQVRLVPSKVAGK